MCIYKPSFCNFTKSTFNIVEILDKNIFYFLKFIFDINISKRFKNIKEKLN